MPSTTQYWFKIRTLPRDVYGVIKQVKATYALTNWQTVILGVTALVHVAKTDGPRFQAMIQQTRQDYPDHTKATATPE